MKNTIVFSPETNCKPSGPTLAFLPAIRLFCCTVWSFQKSKSQQEKWHFISKKNFSSNPVPKISFQQSFLSISGTSLCNLSQYSFHTYESTQMANYASDGTELLCLIRDGSKILRWEKEIWFYQTCGFMGLEKAAVFLLSVHVVLQHRHFTRHSCHEYKQGLRRWWEALLPGAQRWVVGTLRGATKESSVCGRGLHSTDREMHKTLFFLFITLLDCKM